MPRRDPTPTPPHGERVAEELIGLDRDDPETQAFAEHLDRMHRDRPCFTVEGYLDGVSDFADSANRARGGRWLAAVVLTLLLLGVACCVILQAAGFVLGSWMRP
jgi:hypothetical protein